MGFGFVSFLSGQAMHRAELRFFVSSWFLCVFLSLSGCSCLVDNDMMVFFIWIEIYCNWTFRNNGNLLQVLI